MLKGNPQATLRNEALAADNSLSAEGIAVGEDSNKCISRQCLNSEPSQLLLHKHGQIGLNDNLKVKKGALGHDTASEPGMRLQPFANRSHEAVSVLQTYQPSYAGDLCPLMEVYDDFGFRIKTLFFPPTAPNEFPRRVAPSKTVSTPVWKNDLHNAGLREHQAQIMISKIWRGISCRRQQRMVRVYESLLNQRARVIQCWWRTILARKRYNQLLKLKSMWAEKRSKDYVVERLATMQNMMTWQRSRYDGAAILLQRVLRWYLRKCERNRCLQVHNIPEEEWPPELDFPIARKKIVYFPWRRHHCDIDIASDGGDGGPEKTGLTEFKLAFGQMQGGNVGEQPLSRVAERVILGKRTLLQFKKNRELFVPFTWEEVRASNEKSRRKEQERVLCLSDPGVKSRMEWKRQHMDGYDLDFTAGVIQRRYLCHRDVVNLHSAQLRRDYMDHVVRTISRTFHMYVLIKRMKENRRICEKRLKSKIDAYTRERIEDINQQMVWGKELLNKSAATIQNYWHWYLYRTRGVMPKRRRTPPTLGDDADPEQVAFLKTLQEVTEPPSPPFHLIDSFIEKQNKLRMQSMNLIEKSQIRREKNHRYTRYLPEKIIQRRITIQLM